LETFHKPISWLYIEKLNLKQQKHTFTTQKHVQHKINTKTQKPGLVASYDIWPGKGKGLFWFRRFTNQSLTYLFDTYPLTYSLRTHMEQLVQKLLSRHSQKHQTKCSTWTTKVVSNDDNSLTVAVHPPHKYQPYWYTNHSEYSKETTRRGVPKIALPSTASVQIVILLYNNRLLWTLVCQFLG